MKSKRAVNADPDAPQDDSPGTRHGVIRQGSAVERWLRDHLTAVALVVVAAGFGVRAWAAGSGYLNPDEGLHYLLINQPSAFLAYQASLTNAHPPLYFLLLYVWHFLGSSELWLRLPSVLAGTAFCWLAFKWIGAVFGRTAGAIGLVVAAFCPAVVDLSAEVRVYALLLCCMAAALYFLARAFEGQSVRSMWGFSVFLYLAILSHYSAVFFVVAAGLYFLARIGDSQLPRKVVAAWAGGQAGALAIYGVLYVTHVSKVKEQMGGWGEPYYGAYFHPELADLAAFTRVRTANIFRYLFAQSYVAQAMLLFFLAGVVLLFIRGMLLRRGHPRSAHLALLLFLPFVVVWGAAVGGIYPYAASRHTVLLAPFAIAAASYLLAAVANQKLWAGLAMAVVLMAASTASGNSLKPYRLADQRRTLMISAMSYIRQTIPRGERILVDLQSSYPLRYYLCGPAEMFPPDTAHSGFTDFGCDGYPIVSLDYHFWKLTPGNFPTQFEKMARVYGLKPGERVWVFQTGWEANLDGFLPEHFAKFRCLTSMSFGANTTIIPFVVGPDFLPAAPITHCGS